jgi:hypothetical protein
MYRQQPRRQRQNLARFTPTACRKHFGIAAPSHVSLGHDLLDKPAGGYAVPPRKV